MSMTPHSTDITRTLKWMHNNAPAITSLVQQKASWYDANHHQFWADWAVDVFDLRTANDFGMMVWCIILGIPSENFNFSPPTHQFAYGKFRENFVWSGDRDPETGEPVNPLGNNLGGNFSAGISGSVYDPEEIRKLLQIRYAALICNGSMDFVNFMLRWVFNKGEPWDFDAGRYFYLTDSLVRQSAEINIDNVYLKDWTGSRLLKPSISTNFIKASNDLSDPAWGPSGVTISEGSDYPDGSGSANLISSDSTTGVHRLSQLVNVLTQGSVTLTFMAKRGSLAILRASLSYGSGYSVASTIEVDLEAESWKLTAGDATASVEITGDGFVRVSMQVSVTTSDIRLDVALVHGAVLNFTGDPSLALEVGMFQIQREEFIGRYKETDGSGTASAADYELVDASTGEVHTLFTPKVGEALTWDGDWGSADVSNPVLLGEGDGATTTFIASKPGNDVLPVSNTYGLEYRIGPGMGISGQFLVLMQDDDVRILPTFAGVRAQVIQE